jgi:maleamate amidohydrolase
VSVSGFHGRAGFGSRPALLVVDMNCGFTDPRSPLVCDLDQVVEAIFRLLAESRGAGIPVAFTTVSYTEADRRTAAVFIDKVPALTTLEAGSRWVEIDARIAPLPDEPVLNKLFASAFSGTALATSSQPTAATA